MITTAVVAVAATIRVVATMGAGSNRTGPCMPVVRDRVRVVAEVQVVGRTGETRAAPPLQPKPHPNLHLSKPQLHTSVRTKDRTLLGPRLQQ